MNTGVYFIPVPGKGGQADYSSIAAVLEAAASRCAIPRQGLALMMPLVEQTFSQYVKVRWQVWPAPEAFILSFGRVLRERLLLYTEETPEAVQQNRTLQHATYNGTRRVRQLALGCESN